MDHNVNEDDPVEDLEQRSLDVQIGAQRSTVYMSSTFGRITNEPITGIVYAN